MKVFFLILEWMLLGGDRAEYKIIGDSIVEVRPVEIFRLTRQGIASTELRWNKR